MTSKRTAPEAFTEQMRFLRRHGYHALTSADIVRHLADGRPFAGRPVLLSFDDGYRDFHDIAWPILRAHDFTAEVMVVTDLVGKAAKWDVDYGSPAPLMGWPEIQALATAGVRFGTGGSLLLHPAPAIVTGKARAAAVSVC